MSTRQTRDSTRSQSPDALKPHTTREAAAPPRNRRPRGRRWLRLPTPVVWPALSRGESLPSQPLPLALPGRLVVARIAQFAIDIALVAAACYGLLAIWIFVPRAPDGSFANPGITLAAFALNLLAVLAFNIWYWVLEPFRKEGRTFGMHLLGLRVVRTDGGAPTLAQLALRLLLLVADGMIFGLVGAAAMAFTPTRQRLGDLLAATQVIRPETQVIRPENQPRLGPRGGAARRGGRAAAVATPGRR